MATDTKVCGYITAALTEAGITVRDRPTGEGVIIRDAWVKDGHRKLTVLSVPQEDEVIATVERVVRATIAVVGDMVRSSKSIAWLFSTAETATMAAAADNGVVPDNDGPSEVHHVHVQRPTAAEQQGEDEARAEAARRSLFSTEDAEPEADDPGAIVSRDGGIITEAATPAEPMGPDPVRRRPAGGEEQGGQGIRGGSPGAGACPIWTGCAGPTATTGRRPRCGRPTESEGRSCAAARRGHRPSESRGAAGPPRCPSAGRQRPAHVRRCASGRR